MFTIRNARFSFVFLGALFLLGSLNGQQQLTAQEETAQEETAQEGTAQEETASQEKLASIDDPRKLIQAAAKRLVEVQEDDAAWPYEGVYRVRREIPVGYRIGGSAIVCSALLSADLKEDREKADAAIRKSVDLILAELEDPLMKPTKRSRYDVRIWGHIFALDLFCRIKASKNYDDVKEKTNPWIQKLVDAVLFQEVEGGGWNYASRRSHAAFVSATAIQSLLLARDQGIEVPQEVLQRSIKVLKDSRSDNGGFQYSGKGSRKTLMPGSIARSALCETTLIMLGDGDTKALQNAIDKFHEHWDELEKRRKKTGTHEAPYGVAPYYFYFGHRYAAQAIQFLDKEQQASERERFGLVLLKTKDEDNTWNDRVFDRSKAYGTAMAVLALSGERVLSPKPTVASIK